ncbi:Alkaline phosphatase [Altererythrobacter epoxidivorans]|uniref:Alkaline phosphatase n=1 Tax=Altererythrobacter epoxidivorans TaxID=361183 RepID=A0A0M4M9X5_9SPHN|nr:alkaline phosphatase D family protein [Altererythrobacter epoxidivorans]ALE17689.1 Alkaline phosphatase [Altererythrobacter epoxidivorans]
MIKNDPPQTHARPSLPLSRRGLFQLGAASAALAAAPQAARGFGSGFTHGVASGEPGPDKVMLWTRYVTEEDTALLWQVSENEDFSEIVAEGSALAKAENDWCAKSWADGLRGGRWYYYRFTAPDGGLSEIGRTRTLPEGDVASFRMAVFSCSNFGFGYFNAYAHAALANDVELALHLGDYIYEYNRGNYPSPQQAHPDRMLFPENEIVTLADYRVRYATYRADPDLRRIHQVLPMISIWDDHEVANDSWKGGAQNHQSETEGDYELRKRTALKVYREWMPVSDEPYTSYEIGDLATLFRLETRLEGREEQFSLADVLEGATSPEEAKSALVKFRDNTWSDPDRQMLGAEQEAWLGDALKASKSSGRNWQVLVQQVLMGSVKSPPGLLQAMGEDTPDYIRKRLTASAMASAAGLPASMDSWDGYPGARKRVFDLARQADADLLVLAGDSHNAWAFDLDLDGAAVGVEFGVQSVSSPGLETSLPTIPPASFAAAAVSANPQLKWVDTSQRGYLRLELTAEKAVTEFRFSESVKSRSAKLAGTKVIEVPAGSRRMRA